MQLIPAMPGQIVSNHLNKQLIVSTPQAGSDIDNDGIALVFNNREVSYLAGVRWSSTVPDIIQRALIDALTSTNALRGVADERAGIMADARLLCDIRQFSLYYADPEGIPSAVAAANFRLISLSNGSIMGMRSVNVTVPAGGRDARALAAACETALSRCLAEVVPWVVRTLESAR
jgi:cholesterol transport system auxiliary component